MTFDDMSATEELLTVILIQGKTSEYIYNLCKNYIVRYNFPIHKLVIITTDGAVAVIGNKIVLLACFMFNSTY